MNGIHKKFPVLYKRAKTGKILQWSVKVEGSSEVTILTEQGQIDGKKQIYRESILEGKQKRSAYEQAVFMAQSDWNKKKDSGYKSLEDLGIYDTSFAAIGDTFEDLLNSKLPDSNTDANGQVKPMLAKSWERGKCKYPKYAQPKFNGVRCIAICTKQGEITLLSRSGKKYIVDHIIEDFSNLPAQDIILDGELYCHGMDLNRIVSAVKKPNKDTPKLEYHVYDIIASTLSQVIRTTFVCNLLDNSNNSLKAVYTDIVRNDIEVKELHDKYVSEGYEGLILREIDGLYEKGVRSKNLLKVKEFLDDEFYILDAELGSRGTEDMVFILRANNGESFKAKPKGDRKQKEDYMNNLNTLIGKKATVRYFNISEYGIPFHAHVVVVRDYE